jgi:hypothetical protein
MGHFWTDTRIELSTMLHKFGDISRSTEIEDPTGELKLTYGLLADFVEVGGVAPFASLYL